MKKSFKITFILLCFIVMLTSCAKTEDNKINTVMEQNNSVADNTDLHENNETSQDNVVTENGSLPSGYIEAASYIQSLSRVEAYSEGKYVVKGINNENNDFCGVLYENGQLKVFDEYTRVYPLKEGRLLATTEGYPRDLDYENSHIQNATVNGVIIDEDGNLIFSSDKYLRFVPAADNRLFVFSASSGFDGVVFEFGILDCDGNWIYELSQENEIAQLLKDYPEVYSNGFWMFADSPHKDNYWDKSGVYSLNEWQLIVKAEGSVQIVINRKYSLVAAAADNNGQEGPTSVYCTFTYDAETDDLVKGTFNYTLNNADELIQGYRLLSDRSVLFDYWWIPNFRLRNYDIDTMSGEVKEEIKGFYIGNDFYFNSENNVIRNISTGQTVELSDSICSHLIHIYEYENTFYTILRGDDKQYYIQRPGIDENPVLLQHYEKENASETIFFDDIFVYCNEDEAKLYVVDSSTFEMIREIEFNLEGPSYNIEKMDENTIAIKGYYSGGGGSYKDCAIYNLEGVCIGMQRS